ncbi:MAG: TatD family nuclease-associated radical SAM protein [Clostridia bacterium]|nr:TatD family nuclease-associated radical SAM protein [Clostridia bacterium]
MNTFVYEIDDNLYINLTNECSNRCEFCVRTMKDDYEGYDLWLENEPSAEDVLALISEDKQYASVVFCGFGEPTARFDVLKKIAVALKGRYKLRLNTNGQGNLINGRDITAEVALLFDEVNVSLNASTAEKYDDICHSVYGKAAFGAVVEFGKSCAKKGVKTHFSVVDCIGPEEVEACRVLSFQSRVLFRVRKFITG